MRPCLHRNVRLHAHMELNGQGSMTLDATYQRPIESCIRSDSTYRLAIPGGPLRQRLLRMLHGCVPVFSGDLFFDWLVAWDNFEPALSHNHPNKFFVDTELAALSR